MSHPPTSVDYTHYLNGRTKAERMAALTLMAATDASLPLTLAEDLLLLDIGKDERLAVLARASSRDPLAFEHFLTQQAASEDQEVATLALRQWNLSSAHLLWFRILNMVQSPLVSQRVLYTIVDLAFWTGGSRVLQAAAQVEGLDGMSEAMHGLLLHRACEWGFAHPRFDALAESVLPGLTTHLHPHNKALPSGLAYLARFHPSEIERLILRTQVAEPWRDLLRTMASAEAHLPAQTQQLSALFATGRDEPVAMAELAAIWPAMWLRSKLPAGVVSSALGVAARDHTQGHAAVVVDSAVSSPWEFFSGIPAATLEAATLALDSDQAFAAALTLLGGLLSVPASTTLLAAVKQRLATTPEPAVLLQALPLRLRIELTEDGPSSGKKAHLPYAQVKKEEAAVLSGDRSQAPTVFTDLSPVAVEAQGELASRKRFIAVAYRQEKKLVKGGDGFFDLLAQAWQNPTETQLAALADQSRRVNGVFRLCYLKVLGQFKGSDGAVLKLMDFVRSAENDDLRAVLQALGSIGTARAAFELVACLTRPNITSVLQLEACLLLKKLNLTNLQNELHSAINDLGIEPATAGVKWEVRELVVSMLDSTATVPLPKSPTVKGNLEVSDQRLDQELAGKIPNYRLLSSEVKRALRTAQFFHMQVTGEHAPAAIDLSPVIDMQYKSLELLFREVYEEPCSRLIHRGVLQRRLDIIGYARPIPSAMDEFEHFISGLPTVREIPFFSAFKLRKMLRAICQFRPGRRFTLDGLKAFALFFLCFSRSECRYGLAGLFPLGFRSDEGLMQFAKMLHMMQDFRNRAAHEGFHPDAASDIDGIWRSTAEIVQTVFATQAALQAMSQQDHRGGASEKKVS